MNDDELLNHEKKLYEREEIVNKQPAKFKKNEFDEHFKLDKMKPVVDDWEPKWVRLATLGMTFHRPIEQDGMLVDTGRRSSDGYVDVPENLADDVSMGLLDPSMYSTEELRQMSIARHQSEQDMSSMFFDEKDRIDVNNHNGYNHK